MTTFAFAIRAETVCGHSSAKQSVNYINSTKVKLFPWLPSSSICHCLIHSLPFPSLHPTNHKHALRHTPCAVKRNASGYTARQSHAAMWPCCGTTQALPGLSAGVDVGLYAGQRAIQQSKGRKKSKRQRGKKGGRRNNQG